MKYSYKELIEQGIVTEPILYDEEENCFENKINDGYIVVPIGDNRFIGEKVTRFSIVPEYKEEKTWYAFHDKHTNYYDFKSSEEKMFEVYKRVE